MQEPDDTALMRQYTEQDSEEAFARLVARHVNKVYSVAFRHTRNPQQAGEITQAVFVILAKKCRHLSKRVILSGWLYQAARLTAVTYTRSEIRRARREQEACMQTSLNENESDAWTTLAPLLDAAMARLNETDRQAIVLRFFDGQSIRQTGMALGMTEDAAKKRVSRALEKLRTFFARHGVSSTTAMLAGVISANSVQAAPATLATTATVTAIGKGAAAGASTLTLIERALKLMNWTKARTAIITAGTVVLVGAAAVPLLKTVAPKHPAPAHLPFTAMAGTPGGRRVNSAGEIPLGIRREAETVTVMVGNPRVDAVGKVTQDHTLTIEQARVLLDGKERAKISASARDFEVECTKHALSVVIDKTLLFEARVTSD